ncbi:copper transporter [Fodinicola feengrottensis]|uniref:copper transporter n=1 Tax=Fodinicola feengrottensis TaxID=435914 RepID=UPI0013D28E33|nr:copper transporter [Fodinicola feengrottensis]
MINFRYHIVSVMSVLLAVAAGLLLGTFALNGSWAGNAQGANLRQSNQGLRSQVGELQQQASGRDKFVQQIAPTLVGKKLTGHSVLVVGAPGATAADRAAVAKMLTAAGATVSGDIAFTDAFVDPTRNNDEVDLAQRLLPLTVKGLPNNSNGAETSAALIARVFADGKENVNDANRTAILAGYGQLKLLTADAAAVNAAQAVVIVAGKPAEGQDATKKNAAVRADARTAVPVGVRRGRTRRHPPPSAPAMSWRPYEPTKPSRPPCRLSTV